MSIQESSNIHIGHVEIKTPHISMITGNRALRLKTNTPIQYITMPMMYITTCGTIKNNKPQTMPITILINNHLIKVSMRFCPL